MGKILLISTVLLMLIISCYSNKQRHAAEPCTFEINIAFKSQDQLAREDSIAKSVYPNPFSPPTHVDIQVLEKDSLEFSLFDVEGRQVSRPFKQLLEKRDYVITFKPDSCSSPSGVYWMRYKLNDKVTTKKIVIF